MSQIRNTATKIFTVLFCIAAFLGMIDAIISLEEHISDRTVNAGELDVASVQEATEIFVNEGGVLESKVEVATPVIPTTPVQNAVLTDEANETEKEHNYTEIVEANTINVKQEVPQETLDMNCRCSATCLCLKGSCRCRFGTVKCNPLCRCNLLRNEVNNSACNSCSGNSCSGGSCNMQNTRGTYYAGQPIRNGFRYIGNFGRRIGSRIFRPFNGRFRVFRNRGCGSCG